MEVSVDSVVEVSSDNITFSFHKGNLCFIFSFINLSFQFPHVSKQQSSLLNPILFEINVASLQLLPFKIHSSHVFASQQF